MQIIKRNGVKVDFNPSKIHQRIKKQADGLKVNIDEFIKVTAGIANEMTTKQLDDLIAVTSEALTWLHPDYSKLAARICISRHHKETEESFIKLTKKLYDLGILDESYYNIIKDNRDIIQKALNYDRDYELDYLGWSRLKQIYLIKDGDIVVERPQHMYMRIALWTNYTIEEAIEYYHELSSKGISSATPTMINSGNNTGQLASCNLSVLKGDDRDGLLQTMNNISISSSKAEGIGLAISNLRSRKSFVGKEGGLAGGVLKYLKIVNESMRFFNQGGKRNGSCAIYIEPWHKDIIDVLEIKLENGKDENRARDLFTAMWIPDNFMRAVKENSDWYLFCPNKILKAGLKPFQEIYGEEYEEEYNKAVELGIGEKVKATDIWLKIIESQIETGVPYMAYKDHANKKSNHKNIGTIKSSNLCCLAGDTLLKVKDSNDVILEITIKELTERIHNYEKFKVLSVNKEFEYVLIGDITREDSEILEVYDDVNNITIKCTPDHKIFTKNRGYVEAQYLLEDDELEII